MQIETRTIDMDKVTVGPRSRKDLGDIQALAESMRQVDLINPILVDGDYKLIAGERRLAAAKALEWTTIRATVVRDLDEATYHLKAERDENTCRKAMTPSEVAELGMRLEAVEREAAKKRMTATLNQGPRSGTVPERDTKGNVRDKIGEALGVSGKHYENAKKVVQKGTPRLVKLMDENRIGARDAANFVDMVPEPEEQERIIKRDVGEAKRIARAKPPAKKPASSKSKGSVKARPPTQEEIDALRHVVLYRTSPEKSARVLWSTFSREFCLALAEAINGLCR